MSNKSEYQKIIFKFYVLTGYGKVRLHPSNAKSIVRYRQQRKRNWLKRNGLSNTKSNV